ALSRCNVRLGVPCCAAVEATNPRSLQTRASHTLGNSSSHIEICVSNTMRMRCGDPSRVARRRQPNELGRGLGGLERDTSVTFHGKRTAINSSGGQKKKRIGVFYNAKVLKLGKRLLYVIFPAIIIVISIIFFLSFVSLFVSVCIIRIRRSTTS